MNEPTNTPFKRTTRLAAMLVAAGILLGACGSGLPDEAIRTGDLPPTPTPLPTGE